MQEHFEELEGESDADDDERQEDSGPSDFDSDEDIIGSGPSREAEKKPVSTRISKATKPGQKGFLVLDCQCNPGHDWRKKLHILMWLF